MAAPLLRQRLGFHSRPFFHSIYYFIHVITHAFVRLKMLFLVCYSPALDLILYLLHLYPHNPTHQRDRLYILYRHTLRTS